MASQHETSRQSAEMLLENRRSEHPDPTDTLCHVIVDLVIGDKKRWLNAKLQYPAKKRDAMSNTVKRYVVEGRPIPMLIAVVPKKPPLLPDQADLEFLEMLMELQTRVRAVYASGLDIVLRVEDLTCLETYPAMPILEVEGVEQHRLMTADCLSHTDPTHRKTGEYFRAHYRSYVEQFIALSHAVSPKEHLVQVIPESQRCTFETFHEKVYQYTDVLDRYLSASSNSGTAIDFQSELDACHAIGFRGEVCPEARQFLSRCYSNKYPWMTAAEKLHMMARYYACTVVRRELQVTMHQSHWNHGRLEMSIVESIPGGAEFETTRVWYKVSDDPVEREPFWRQIVVFDEDADSIKLLSFARDTEFISWKSWPIIHVATPTVSSMKVILPVFLKINSRSHKPRG